MSNFHVSLPCKSVEVTKRFYVNSLQLEIGREAYNWVDIDIFGNQITFAEKSHVNLSAGYYSFESKRLPIFHIGVILSRPEWNELLAAHEGKYYFEMEPTVFLRDKVGEHDSFFLKDPNGYYLEFKTFKDHTEIFKQKIKSISD